MADVVRGDGYWRGMCAMAEKIHRGSVSQFGGDPQSMEDLAGLLQGLGHLDLSELLMAAAKDYEDAAVLTVDFDECPPVVRRAQ